MIVTLFLYFVFLYVKIIKMSFTGMLIASFKSIAYIFVCVIFIRNTAGESNVRNIEYRRTKFKW